MAALTWDGVGERWYETGVSKGVLYKSDGYGVAWNGLTSVEQNVDNEIEPVYFDGFKFNDVVTIGDFSATLRALTYPDEFLHYSGLLEDQTGFYITNQALNRFGLSYRTEIGNDVESESVGYKIHLVYNAIAVPSQVNHQTASDSLEALEFEWTLSTVPEEIEDFIPTAHVIFDSRKLDPYLLVDLEGILYGDDDNNAYLPPLQSLASFIRKWERLVIIDNKDGTWTAKTPTPNGVIVKDSPTSFIITTPNAEFLDPDTYNIWSTDKNEEDIWG